MNKRILIGEKFNRLTVLEENGRSSDGSIIWKCRCKCGNETNVVSHKLKNGSTKSCGCLFKDVISTPKENLVGKQFGNLIVLGYISQKDGVSYWKCMCQCKNKTIVMVRPNDLKSGHTKSCGCLRKEKEKKFNKYDLSQEYGIGFSSNTNSPFYFDLEDYDLIKNYTWCSNKGGYLITNIFGKLIFMHRLIMSCKINEYVDHINHNTSNNRKTNLRKVTKKENSFNCSKSINNTSGCTGVVFEKRTEKWVAQIMVNGKNIYIGSSKDKKVAIELRKQAEIKYFGEFRNKGDK